MSKADIVVGATAPDFTLPDEAGKQVHLGDFRGKRVVLYFYPKDDTPGWHRPGLRLPRCLP